MSFTTMFSTTMSSTITERKSFMHRSSALVAMSLFVSVAAWAQDLKSEDDKMYYSLGVALARELHVFNLGPKESELVKKGVADQLAGTKPLVDPEAYRPRIQKLAEANQAKANEKAAAGGKEFLDKAAKEKGAVKTESGLVYLSTKDGTGASPKASDKVKVHYRGTLTNGTEFDSSYKRGQPIEFPLGNVIKCWTEGVQKMKVGGKAKLVCPPEIAYGERGAGGTIPPNATLVFEVELLDIGK